MLGRRGVSWVGMSVQNKFFGDEPERSCDCLNLDFMSVTILAFPHGNSKGEESVREDMWRLDFARGIMIEPTVHLPCFPVAMPLGSVHCCSAICFPRSISKTLNLSQRSTAVSVYRWLSGNGNTVSKDKQKSMSDRLGVELNSCWAFEGRDAMLAITFSIPGT